MGTLSAVMRTRDLFKSLIFGKLQKLKRFESHSLGYIFWAVQLCNKAKIWDHQLSCWIIVSNKVGEFEFLHELYVLDECFGSLWVKHLKQPLGKFPYMMAF